MADAVGENGNFMDFAGHWMFLFQKEMKELFQKWGRAFDTKFKEEQARLAVLQEEFKAKVEAVEKRMDQICALKLDLDKKSDFLAEEKKMLDLRQQTLEEKKALVKQREQAMKQKEKALKEREELLLIKEEGVSAEREKLKKKEMDRGKREEELEKKELAQPSSSSILGLNDGPFQPGGEGLGPKTRIIILKSDEAGAIIGRNGERIRRIRAESEATISIDYVGAGSTDRIVTIYGSPLQIRFAEFLIHQYV